MGFWYDYVLFVDDDLGDVYYGVVVGFRVVCVDFGGCDVIC